MTSGTGGTKQVINTDVIDNIDEQIQELTDYLDNALTTLKDIENIPQQVVDDTIDEVEDIIESFLQKIRKKVIKGFNELYHNAADQKGDIEALATKPKNVEEAVTWVGKAIDYFFPQAKVAKLVAAMADILTKVANISNNIQKIASYKSSVSIPNISVRRLNITIPQITASDITGPPPTN